MAWVAAVAGIGMNALGQEQAAASTLKGAEAQAQTQRMNREYQRKIFDESIEMQKPYYEAGLKALPMLEEFRSKGGIDLSGNPLYQNQIMRGREGLDMAGDVRPGGYTRFGEMSNAMSQGPAYRRLIDLQQVGMGAAGEAGNYAQNQGGALSASYQNAGNAMAQGAGNAANQRASMYSNAAGSIGNMPAYFDYQRRTGGQ